LWLDVISKTAGFLQKGARSSFLQNPDLKSFVLQLAVIILLALFSGWVIGNIVVNLT